MQSDELVWQIINHGHCSYKAKMKPQNFCRNENNVTGLCNRSSCPLANSRYATIRESKGRLYLCIKTVERAHTPKNLWQRIRLSRNYLEALEQVNGHLEHWPKFLVHKNKQRLTKVTQYMIRMRRLALKPRTKIVTVPTRLKKQEARKEVKAAKAANIEAAVEAELLTRLRSGTYGDIYNFPMAHFNKALDHEKAIPDGETDPAAEVEEEELDEDAIAESDEEEEVEYVEGLEESDEEVDMEDLAGSFGDDLARGFAGASDDDDEGSSGDEGDDEEGDSGSEGGAGGARAREGREVELEMEEERELEHQAAR